MNLITDEAREISTEHGTQPTKRAKMDKFARLAVALRLSVPAIFSDARAARSSRVSRCRRRAVRMNHPTRT